MTAGQLYGLSLPLRYARPRPFYFVTRHRSYSSDSDPEVVLHRLLSATADRQRLYGIPVSAPGELFVELARYLSIPELVIVGDQLVRRPHQDLESRRAAWCNLPELERSVAGFAGRTGVRNARQAQALVRVGADSAPETLLRLALTGAGLPEPELQIRLDPGDPFSPTGDAGYRKERVVIQYEGEHHFTAEQQARDQRRNTRFEAAGWTVVLVNRVDLRESFSSVIVRIRRLLTRGLR